VTAAPPLLEVDSVTLHHGGVAALAGVTLDVAPGEVLAVIGPNGAGKTSLLNCVTGVSPPQSGTIRLDGADLCGRRPSAVARLGVARTFQDAGLFAGLDVLDHLLAGRHLAMRTGFLTGALWWGRARREEAAGRRRCGEIAELLDLAPFLHRPVGGLPFGVRKRVDLGRAMAMEPRLLLLDEPGAGASAAEAEAMAGVLDGLRTRRETAVVLVEHDLALVEAVADRAVALDRGRAVARGAVAEVTADPAVVEAYMGGGTGGGGGGWYRPGSTGR
jgi:branched-chain amino acid transport system ATP-binding protein